jgi:hypothetical protein
MTVLSKDEARKIVYGMAYKEWQARYQTGASDEALAKFANKGGSAHKV